MKLNNEAVKARFHELNGQMRDIQNKSAALRAERDQLRNDLENDPRQKKIKELGAKINAMEAPLADLAPERSGCVAYLKGKTGVAQAA